MWYSPSTSRVKISHHGMVAMAAAADAVALAVAVRAVAAGLVARHVVVAVVHVAAGRTDAADTHAQSANFLPRTAPGVHPNRLRNASQK
jgi:hypothetical protein